MERKPPKSPMGMGNPMVGKPLVSRRRQPMAEAPVAAPMGARKTRKPPGMGANPIKGSGKPRRGMF